MVITHSTMHRLVCKQRESCKCYKRRSPGQHLYCRLIRLCVCSGGTFVWIQTWCILQWGRMVYFIAAYSQEVCFPPKKILLPPYLLTMYSVLKTKKHKKHLWSFDKNLHNRENISFIFFVKKCCSLLRFQHDGLHVSRFCQWKKSAVFV